MPHRDAEALLGAGHPLVAVLDADLTVQQRIAAVAAVLLGALPLWWTNASYAGALAIAVALVLTVLGLRWAGLRARCREVCVELVVMGRGDMPLAAVRREHQRLASRSRQMQLARSLEDLADMPLDGRCRHALYTRRVLAASETQLRDVAARLRAGRAGVRGVAVLERLISSGRSPLYGAKPGPLHDELARARHLLA